MITEKAYAKINLSLEITEKRLDGFHNLNTIMIPLELHDVLHFEENKKVVINGNIEIENNNMFETIKLIKERFNVKKGVKLTYEKNIPLGGGLGGGSANIAAVIRGLNVLWDLELSVTEQEQVAVELGSDTLHCLHNKASHIFGRGDKLEFISTPNPTEVYLICNRDMVLTKDVFANHEQLKKESNFSELIGLYESDFEVFKSVITNDLLYATLSISSSFAKTFYELKKMSPHVYMSGSGPTLFVLGKPCQAILDYVKENNKQLFGIQTRFKI